jgi:predicted RNA-binding Zn ribbon-like protein
MTTQSGQTQVAKTMDGKLCLAFVNTVAWRKTAAPEERLGTPAALAEWCVSAGLIDRQAAGALKRHWKHHATDAFTMHRRALLLREAIYGLCRCKILKAAPSNSDLGAFNELLAAAPARHQLGAANSALGWKLDAGRSRLDPLTQILWSAADLLTGPLSDRMRQCEDPQGCGWLFLDESRAGTRRWCSMGNCGNRAKARRHYLRAKQVADR